MSPSVLAALAAIKRQMDADRSAGYRAMIESGASKREAAYYSAPHVFYSPLQMLQREGTRTPHHRGAHAGCSYGCAASIAIGY